MILRGDRGCLGSPMSTSPKASSFILVNFHPLSSSGLLGIDGPAAFLKPEAQDLEIKPKVLSVGSPTPEEGGTEGSADGESPVETASKPDLQEILQKHGEGGAELKTGNSPFSHRLIL